jgi:hypothetical protein
MIAANAYRIRFSTAADSDTLSGLAERDSQEPLVGRVLIGYIDGTPAAALSLHDGRVIADTSRQTDRVVSALRVRASAIRAFEATPSLRQRLLAALPKERGRSVAAPVPLRQSHDEQKAARIAA